MKNDKDIDGYIEEVLNSLEGVNRATARPYLLTRIYAKLERQTKSLWENAAYFISRPAVVISGLCFVIAVNVMVIMMNSFPNNNSIADMGIPEP